MILYGIPTCDTCKKAQKALVAAGHDVAFRDVRKDPLTPEERAEVLAAFGEKIINRASTTWRNLDEADKARDPAALLADHPTLMKRPVIRTASSLHLGWAKTVQAELI